MRLSDLNTQEQRIICILRERPDLVEGFYEALQSGQEKEGGNDVSTN